MKPVRRSAVHPDAEARATIQSPRREKILAEEDAARAPAAPIEEIAVDPGESRAARLAPLHRGHGLPAGDEPVGEHGLQVVEAARLRRLEHVHDNALPANRVHFALVYDPRRELYCRCRRWKRGRRDDREKDSFPQHPVSRETKSDPDYKAAYLVLTAGNRPSSRRERRDRACRAAPRSCRAP